MLTQLQIQNLIHIVSCLEVKTLHLNKRMKEVRQNHFQRKNSKLKSRKLIYRVLVKKRKSIRQMKWVKSNFLIFSLTLHLPTQISLFRPKRKGPNQKAIKMINQHKSIMSIAPSFLIWNLISNAFRLNYQNTNALKNENLKKFLKKYRNDDHDF